MWHCPHCGSPQAEAARCWVCHRSSTTCSTCRHFRGSLAADVNYCGLDPKRRPLTGLELRGCWEEGARRAPSVAAWQEHGPRRPARTVRPLPVVEPVFATPIAPRTFVPVGETVTAGVPRRVPRKPPRRAVEPAPAAEAMPTPIPDAVEAWERRTSLFGDLDR